MFLAIAKLYRCACLVESFIVNVSGNESMLRNERPRAKLTCEAKGYPPPLLEWVMVNELCSETEELNTSSCSSIDEKRTSFRSCSLVVSGGGTYQCRIRVQVSTSQSTRKRKADCVIVNGIHPRVHFGAER